MKISTLLRNRNTWVFFALSLLYCIPSWVRYASWRGSVWDMGYFVNALWSISHGHWLACSPFEDGMPALGDAASFILYPLALWYRATGPYGLLWIQAISLLSGIVFLLRWGRRFQLTPIYSVVLIGLFLIFPTIWGSLLFDFHPDVFAIPLLCALVESVWDCHWRKYWVLFFLNLLVKGTMPVTLFGVGIMLLIQRHRWQGWLSLLLSSGWMAAIALWLLPKLSPTGNVAQWSSTYGWVSHSPRSFLGSVAGRLTILATPWGHSTVWVYLFGIAAGVAFIPFFYKQSLIVLIPASTMILFNVYSHYVQQQWLVNQYSLFMVPFLFASLTIAMSLLTKRTLRFTFMALPIPILVASLTWKSFGPILWPTRAARQLTVASQLIPPQAPVYGQDFTLYKLVNRSHVAILTSYPQKVPNDAFVLLDKNQNIYQFYGISIRKFQVMLLDFEKSPQWKELYHQGPVYLFHKIGS